MGDLQAWPQPNGTLTEDSSFSANPDPSAIDANRWAKAELRTSQIISCIQPTVISERRRQAVIDYVQRLIRRSLGCEVFTFGSVPLKTYLPDGDIDLTTFSNLQNVGDTWANEVRCVLEGEECSKFAEFKVKEVQYIHAEVRLVKCLVENIVVDISFNQLGGLCTLCFLERVDRLIGKDHLFKRSIILIKAWCYYESRILGAHHGLISTYALETLVMYIFHLFHASLRGPLEVLYKFLDYFSKFDWDNYCVSIQGPVSISALPEIIAIQPETDGGKLLLNKEFLKICTDLYSTFPKGHDNQSRSFISKHLNVIDPLRENNNLGRSVSKGNFYRIRSAFTYGARKLGKILLSTEERIAEELGKFFLNTLDRHGNGQRPDVPDSILCGLESRLSGKSTGFLVLSKSDVEDRSHEKNEIASSEEGKAQAAEMGILPKKSTCESDQLHEVLLSTEGMGTMAEDYRAHSNTSEIAKDKATLVNFGTIFTGGHPEMASFAKHPVGNETGEGMKSPSFSDVQHECPSGINSTVSEEGSFVCRSRFAGDAKDLASNIHYSCEISKSKSPGLLLEQRTLTKGCNFQPSGIVRMKGITGSGSASSNFHSPSTAEKDITFEGDLTNECARTLTCNEAAVSCHSNYPTMCVYNDRQSANHTKQTSAGKTIAIQDEKIDANTGWAMKKPLQTDTSTPYAPASLVIDHSEVASCPSACVADSLFLPSMPVGPLLPQNVPKGHSSISLSSSSTRSGLVSHDSAFHVPRLASSSVEDRALESGKLKQAMCRPLKVNDCATSKTREISEQGTFNSEIHLEGNKYANGDDNELGSASVVNPVPTEEAIFGVYEYPEGLLPSPTVRTNHTNIQPRGIASSLPASKSDGPVPGSYNPPVQLNRVSAAAEPLLSSGKEALSLAVGGVQLPPDTSESLQHPLNDASLCMDPPCIHRLAGSAISNSAVRSSDVSFSSVDIPRLFSPVPSNSEELSSIIDMGESFKGQQARKRPQSIAACHDTTNSASITGSGLNSMPMGAVLDDFHLRADLTGDFESHSSNLAYGRWCQDSALYGSVLPFPMLPAYMQEQYVWEGHVRPFHANMNMLSYRRGRGAVPLYPFFHTGYLGANPSALPGTFSGEELPKSRNGTGTYFPNLSHRPYKDRYSPNRGRSQGALAQEFTPRMTSQMHRPRSNGRNQSMFDSNFHRQTGKKNIDANLAEGKNGAHETCTQEPLYKSSIQPISGNMVLASSVASVAPEIHPLTPLDGHEKPYTYTEAKPPPSPFAMMEASSKDLIFQSEQLEFGSFGPVQLGAISSAVKSEQGRHMDCAVSNKQLFNSISGPIPSSSSERIVQKPGALVNHERVSSRSYHLKEEDFPPLSFPKQHGGNSTGAGNANSSSQHQTFGEDS